MICFHFPGFCGQELSAVITSPVSFVFLGLCPQKIMFFILEGFQEGAKINFFFLFCFSVCCSSGEDLLLPENFFKNWRLTSYEWGKGCIVSSFDIDVRSIPKYHYILGKENKKYFLKNKTEGIISWILIFFQTEHLKICLFILGFLFLHMQLLLG